MLTLMVPCWQVNIMSQLRSVGTALGTPEPILHAIENVLVTDPVAGAPPLPPGTFGINAAMDLMNWNLGSMAPLRAAGTTFAQLRFLPPQKPN